MTVLSFARVNRVSFLVSFVFRRGIASLVCLQSVVCVQILVCLLWVSLCNQDLYSLKGIGIMGFGPMTFSVDARRASSSAEEVPYHTVQMVR